MHKVGLFFVGVVNLLITLLPLLMTVDVMKYPDDRWNDLSRFAAPYIFALIVAFYLSLLCVFVRVRRASTAVLAFATAIGGLMVLQAAAVVYDVLPGNVINQAPVQLWFFGLGGTILLALNYWYFLASGGVRLTRNPN
jgi:hypothetical protein